MTPILVINRDYVSPDTDFQALQELGYEFIWTDGSGAQVPTVQMVPSKADRRFTAACAALQGMYANSALTGPRAADANVRATAAVIAADALLAELDKPK